ncbi:phage tail tip lysozyme [Acetobacter sp.]|uniref:phage tail tip lysozyme n=1 Tax=Acetobacter sp. TaxID=440 RepID=UPI0039EA27F4
MSGYAVTISAVDNLSKTLNRINQNATRSLAPFRKLGGAVTRLMRTTGVSGVSRALGNVGRSARDAFQRLSSIVAPLGAISGAATLGGMYRMVSAWSNWGTELGNVSRNMGITAQALGNLQGAAQMTGSSGEALTNGLGALGQNLYDAVGGRNAGVVVMMNTLGVAFRKSATQARSVTDVLPELADKIASLADPYAQAQAASTLFGGSAAAMLPFLRRGSAGIREYQQAAERYLHITPQTAQAANTFREAQTRLTLAVEGFGNRISEKLAPVLGPLLTQFAEWIATSPAVTQAVNAIGDGVQHFANWLKAIDWNAVGQQMQQWGGRILWVTNLLGGPGDAIRDLLVLTAGGFAIRLAAPWIGLGFAIGKSILTLALWIKDMRAGTAVVKEAASAQEALDAASAAGTSGLGAMAARAGTALRSLGSIVASIGASVIPALISPAGLAVAAVAGIGLAAYEIWKHWSGLKKLFSSLWDGITATFKSAWNNISPILDKVGDALGRLTGADVTQPSRGITARDAVDRAGTMGQIRGSNLPASQLSTPETDKRTNDAMRYFVGQGWTSAQAAGIVANLRRESGLNDKAVGDSGRATGIAQWHPDRQAAIENHFGVSLQRMSYAQQLQAVDYELRQGAERVAGQHIAMQDSGREAGAAASLYYERPADRAGEAYRRGALAQSIETDFMRSQAASGPPMQVSSLSVPSSGSSTMAGSRAQDTVHRVEVSAAPGTRAKVTDPSGSTRVVRNNVTGTVP